MFMVPPYEGYNVRFSLCDHLSDRKPRQEGALWLMVSVVPACCGRRREHREVQGMAATRNRTVQAQGPFLVTDFFQRGLNTYSL